MLFIFLLSQLLSLFFPTITFAHPAQVQDRNSVAVRSTGGFAEISRPIARAESVSRDHGKVSIGVQPNVEASIPSKRTPDNTGSNVTIATFSNLTNKADPGKSIDFDWIIPIPIPKIDIYVEIKGVLESNLDCTIEVWVHALFSYDIGVYHQNLKKGLDFHINIDILQADALLRVVTSDGYNRVIFEMTGRVSTWVYKKQFHLRKELAKWPVKDALPSPGSYLLPWDPSNPLESFSITPGSSNSTKTVTPSISPPNASHSSLQYFSSPPGGTVATA